MSTLLLDVAPIPLSHVSSISNRAPTQTFHYKACYVLSEVGALVVKSIDIGGIEEEPYDIDNLDGIVFGIAGSGTFVKDDPIGRYTNRYLIQIPVPYGLKTQIMYASNGGWSFRTYDAGVWSAWVNK